MLVELSATDTRTKRSVKPGRLTLRAGDTWYLAGQRRRLSRHRWSRRRWRRGWLAPPHGVGDAVRPVRRTAIKQLPAAPVHLLHVLHYQVCAFPGSGDRV
jgi:hypothetical protein